LIFNETLRNSLLLGQYEALRRIMTINAAEKPTAVAYLYVLSSLFAELL
jgi:hypothetical protein